MRRSPSSCDEIGLKRGPWTPEEDEKLVSFITQRGHDSWQALPKLAEQSDEGKRDKSSKLRMTNFEMDKNYLRPDIKRGKFSQQEQQTILNLHSILGSKWSVIDSHLPGRTDNEIKNFWNTHLKKRLIQMGFDPITHMPTTFNNTITQLHFLSLQDLQNLPSLEHQVEALQMASLQEYLHNLLQIQPSDPFTSTFQPLQYDRNMSAPFVHLPDLEVYGVSDDPTMTEFHRRPDIAAASGGLSGASMWVSSSSANAPPPLLPVAANSDSESAPSADMLIFEDYSFFSQSYP